MDYVRDRLYDELTVDWPLIDIEQSGGYIFPELGDEELSDLERSMEYTRDPEDEAIDL